MKQLIFIFFIMCLISTVLADFEYYEPKPGWGVNYSSLAWGDYNNDGYPDLALAGHTGGGNRIFHVYANNGNGTINTNAIEPETAWGVQDCAVAWGDLENDGDLDLAVAGWDGGSYILRVYKNLGNGNFDSNEVGFANGYRYCALKWLDYNNDGYADLAVSGTTAAGIRFHVYKNLKNGTFDTAKEPVPGWGVSECSITAADFNEDGYIDIALAGSSMFYIFTNYHGTNFCPVPYEPEPGWGVSYCSIAALDFDCDGDQDLAVTGYDNSPGFSRSVFRIYINEGKGKFSQDQIEPEDDTAFGVYYSSMDTIDYNSDNITDLVLTGYDSFNKHPFRIYKNNGDGTFDYNEIEPDPGWGVQYGCLDAADYDKDGSPDIAIVGYNDTTLSNYFRIYKNPFKPVKKKYPENEVRVFPNYLDSEQNTIKIVLGEDEDTEKEYQVWLTTINGVIVKDFGKIKSEELQAGYTWNAENDSIKLNTGLYLIVINKGQDSLTRKLFIRRKP